MKWRHLLVYEIDYLTVVYNPNAYPLGGDLVSGGSLSAINALLEQLGPDKSLSSRNVPRKHTVAVSE